MSEEDDGARSTRFQPGRSGNPKGRPRKAKAPQMDSAFDVLKNRRINACIDGVDRELTLDEAILHRTYRSALEGSPMAIRTILKLIVDHEASRSPRGRSLPQISCEFPDPAHVDEALIILGIAVPFTSRVQPDGRRDLQLTSWAVNSGLARKRARPVTDKDLKELRAHTADPEGVNWPRGGQE